MSKWDEAHTEPMHDHPAEKDQLVAAMEAAGYVLDTAESTEDNLRFFGAYGNVLTMGGWHECEEWLNGVVFDDPQVSDRVEIILHPERYPERDPQRAALRAVEDAVEQNDNNFDGIINNMPQPDPAEVLRAQARQSEQTAARDSILEDLKAQRERAEQLEKAKRRPRILRHPEEREHVCFPEVRTCLHTLLLMRSKGSMSGWLKQASEAAVLIFGKWLWTAISLSWIWKRSLRWFLFSGIAATA